MKKNTKIAIYGDSIMRGIVLDPKESRYRPLAENSVKLAEVNLGISVKNRSHFGFTVDKGLSVLEKDLSAGLECDLAVIEYGGNDCNFNWREISDAPDLHHDPVTILVTFERLYRHMIDELKEKKIVTAVMNLPPIDAEKYFRWITKPGLSGENILRWLGDKQMIYRFQELYSDVVTRLAYETRSVLIDVRSAFLCRHDYGDLLCEDGIHPSKAGHRVIYEAFARVAELE